MVIYYYLVLIKLNLIVNHRLARRGAQWSGEQMGAGRALPILNSELSVGNESSGFESPTLPRYTRGGRRLKKQNTVFLDEGTCLPEG